jgi:hypothetical protein
VVANVAQLVEQRFRKARVAGSSPVVGSIPPITIRYRRESRLSLLTRLSNQQDDDNDQQDQPGGTATNQDETA